MNRNLKISIIHKRYHLEKSSNIYTVPTVIHCTTYFRKLFQMVKMEQQKLTLLTEILWFLFMCSSKDQIIAHYLNLLVVSCIWVLSINKNLYDFSIFLTHTKLQLILWTGNSASLLLQDFYSECWFLTLTLVMWPLSDRKIEPALFEKCLAFCQTLAN